MQKGKFNIVIGGQAGSEAKGKHSAYLAEQHNPDLITMTASPNAGHTVVDDSSNKWVSYHLPISSVTSDCPIILGPASLINYRKLEEEINSLPVDPGRIMIDPRASIIHEFHVEQEAKSQLSDIGSTLQGIGACRRSKMKRKGRGEHTLAHHIRDILEHECGVIVLKGSSSRLVNDVLDKGGRVLAESTQGFDLDLEHGIDPVYCTSKMVNPSMVAAEVGVSPSMVGEIHAVIRPYPIRVNNRTGTSGPYAEAREIDWQIIASRCNCREPLEELTTTTKLPRRVFEFSRVRFQQMIAICRPTSIALQFANYLDWRVYGATEASQLTSKVIDWVVDLEISGGVPVEYVGTGPLHREMIYCPGGFVPAARARTTTKEEEND